ncbi:GntR family transcriptional regulator [Micromonospora sp. NPDC003241]
MNDQNSLITRAEGFAPPRSWSRGGYKVGRIDANQLPGLHDRRRRSGGGHEGRGQSRRDGKSGAGRPEGSGRTRPAGWGGREGPWSGGGVGDRTDAGGQSRLRSRILSGEPASGDKLSTEKDMQQRWGFSTTIIKHALTLLRSEGLIEGRRGSGDYVRDRTQLIRRAHSRDMRKRLGSSSPFARDSEAASGDRVGRRRARRSPRRHVSRDDSAFSPASRRPLGRHPSRPSRTDPPTAQAGPSALSAETGETPARPGSATAVARPRKPTRALTSRPCSILDRVVIVARGCHSIQDRA